MSVKLKANAPGVLIVEPSENTRAFYNTILSKAGNFNVFTAVTAQDAVNILNEYSPKKINVAIVDIFSQAVGASVLLQRLKSDANTDHIEVLVCSDTLSKDDQVLLNEFDVRYTLKKSISTNELISKIEEILRDQSEQATIRRQMKDLSHAILSNDMTAIESALKQADVREVLERNSDYFYLNGELRIMQKEYDQAVQVLSDHLREKGESGTANTFKTLSTLGKALCLSKRYDEALIIFERLAVQSPRNLNHKLFQGESLLGKGQIDEAKAKYREVLDLDPSNSDAQVGMGKAALAEGNTDEAVNILSGIKGDIESYSLASYFNNAAISLTRAGKYDAAIDLYRQAIPFFKQYRWHIVFNMAMTHLRRGDFEAACDMFDDVLEGQPALADKKLVLREYRNYGLEFIKKKYAHAVGNPDFRAAD